MIDGWAADKALQRAVEAHQELRAAEQAFETVRGRHQLERARAIRDARAAGLTLAGIAEHLRVSTERVRQMGAILDDTPADASA
jgi:transposase